MTSLIIKIINSYFLVLALALIAGVIFSKTLSVFSPLTSLILGAIFFLSALKIDFKEIKNHFKNKTLLLVITIINLIVLPIIIYYLSNLVFSSLAVALLLLSAMPSGMTAPLLSEIANGRQSLALVLTVLSSLLAPLTIPLIIQTTIGKDISIDFWAMFFTLISVIIIPFILAQIVKNLFKNQIKKYFNFIKPLSILLLGFLIAIIVGKQALFVMEELITGTYIFHLIVMFFFFIIINLLSYLLFFWKNKEERISIAVCFTYINFTLAIYLADKFFKDPQIIIPVVLSMIPWLLIFVPFKIITNYKLSS